MTKADPVAGLICRPARNEADRRAIFELRYHVYVEEMTKHLACANHVDKTVKDELDEYATIFLVETTNGEVVATLRSLWGGKIIPDSYRAWFALDRFPDILPGAISFSSRLMIKREWRRGQALRLLLRESYHHGRNGGVWLDFIHCAPGLVSLYEVLGYGQILDRIVATDVGQHVPMALVTDDVAHLKAARSPFLKDAKLFAQDTAHATWFCNRFPEYATPASCRLVAEPDFLDYLSRQLTVEEVKLFRKVPETDISELLVTATILNVSAGDTIVKAGDQGSEIFVLLDGAAEVRVPHPPSYIVTRTMGKGEVFGEIAQLTDGRRSADVTAVSNARIMTLPPDFLERTLESNPPLGGRLALNLALVLAERLATVPNTFPSEG